MPDFKLDSAFTPTADQPKAIAGLSEGIDAGERFQTLLGATGTGKTMTMAATIEAVQRPTLVIAHNKTLAAQLCNEFRTFFPDNAVEYFVSYYDYYQPEAYVPSRDLYIEKDSAINQEIDRLRHAATAALFARRDVIVVASVSCIYGLGSPETYDRTCRSSGAARRSTATSCCASSSRSSTRATTRCSRAGRFRVRGETLEVFPAYAETAYRATLFGDEVERLQHFDPLTGELIEDDLEHVAIWPATHYNVKEGTIEARVAEIGRELNERCERARGRGQAARVPPPAPAHAVRHGDAARDGLLLRDRELLADPRRPQRRASGPYCLIDYFPDDFVCFLDESHQTVPQIGGMYEGDRSRKQTLVDYGFRLPSALDNRPQTFDEFLSITPQMRVRLGDAGRVRAHALDADRRADRAPDRDRRPARRGARDEEPDRRPDERDPQARRPRRAHAGDDADEEDVRGPHRATCSRWASRSRYLHSEIDTLERIQIIRDLRLGEYDVLVGVNLLREGLDLPEVSLVGDPRRRQGGLPAR